MSWEEQPLVCCQGRGGGGVAGAGERKEVESQASDRAGQSGVEGDRGAAENRC